MKKILAGLGGIMIIALLLTACGSAPRLQDGETQLYTNEAGYHIMLPASWALQEELEESSIFCNDDNTASLTLINELGGEAYYGLDEITEMLLKQLSQDNGSHWQQGRLFADKEDERRQLYSGLDQAGLEVYLDITVLQPYPGIRYYLLFATSKSAYQAYNTLFADIVDSFETEHDLPYLYALMEERRENSLSETGEMPEK